MIADTNIFLLLRQLARTRPNVKLLNVYKGLPISYDASISSVGNADILVNSNRYQLACLYYQRETYLLGGELPFLLRSDVVSLNLGKENAILANLEVAQNGIGNRSQIRVEPEEPLVARIRFEGSPMEFLAPIVDISAEGGAAEFENYMFPIRVCHTGSPVAISITLPDTISQKIKKFPTRPLPNTSELRREYAGAVVLSTTGKVTSVRLEQEGNRYRVGMRLFFKDLARTVILQYISQRQSEIIRDLGILTDELYKLKKQ
jgi:hypothetical protein